MPLEVVFLAHLLLTGAVLFALARGGLAVAYSERLAGLAPGVVARAFVVGTWHDLTFLAWLLLPVWGLLFARRGRTPSAHRRRRAVEVWIGVCTFLLLVGVASDIAHFREFGVRLNGSSLDYLRQPGHLLSVLHHEFFLGPIVALLVGASWSAARLARRYLARLDAATAPLQRRAALASGAVLAALVFGGSVPARAADGSSSGPSAAYIPHSYVANQLAQNGPWRFVAACLDELQPDASSLARLSAFPADAARAIVRESVVNPGEVPDEVSTHPLARTTPARTAPTGRNVVIVLMESQSARGIRSLGGEHDDAPCFDALAADGVLFTNHFAVGTRTNRGLVGVLSSLPSLPGQSPICALQPGDHIQTLAGVLARQGYRSVAVYGGDRAFDNLDEFTCANGFDRLVALDDFRSPTFVTEWGVSDEDLFDRALAELNDVAAQGEPFLGFVLTLSNHRPHRVPPGRVAPADPDDPQGPARESFRYADHALGRFMDAARREPWFDDTLFVFVADHGSDLRGGAAPDVASFRVPLLLYAPGFLPPRRIDGLVSQVDVLPTVLGVVGGEHTHCSFGCDLFAGPPPGRAMMCVGDVLLWREADLVAVWPRDGELETFSMAQDGTLVPLAAGDREVDRNRVVAHLLATTRLAWDVSRPARHHVAADLSGSRAAPVEGPRTAVERYDPTK